MNHHSLIIIMDSLANIHLMLLFSSFSILSFERWLVRSPAQMRKCQMQDPGRGDHHVRGLQKTLHAGPFLCYD